MTTKEFAEYIKMNEKTVLKMAQSGEIPGVRIGNQWRFHIKSIDNYLQKKAVKSPDSKLNSMVKSDDQTISLSRLTGLDYIKIDSQARSADELLYELSEMAHEKGLTGSKSELFGELQKREKMLSTAVGNRAAVPHPRNPDPKIFTIPKVIIIRTCQGIDFGAPDNQQVYIFFMICAPNEFIHLRLLAKIAKLLNLPHMMDRLISSDSKEQIMQIFMEFDREQMFSMKK